MATDKTPARRSGSTAVKASTEMPEDGEAVRTPTVTRIGKNTSKGKPFDLKAAFAAKLSAQGDVVTMDVYGVEIEAQSMALWTEQQIRESNILGPFEVLDLAFGEDKMQAVRDAMKEQDEGELTILHSQLLFDEFRRRSGLGAPGE